MPFESWVKIDSFKLQNKSICDLLIGHRQGKKFPDVRLDYGYLSEWPIYDELVDRVLWDNPERFPAKVRTAVENLYRKLYKLHVSEV